MPEIPIPIANQNFDPSDGSSYASLGMLAVGFALLFVSAAGGQRIANYISGVMADVVGVDPQGGDENQIEVV